MSRGSAEHEPFMYKDGDEEEELQELSSDKPQKHHPKSRRHCSSSKTWSAPVIIAIVLSAVASSMLTLVLQSLALAWLDLGSASRPEAFSLPHLNVTELGPVAKAFRDEPVYLNRSTPEGVKASEEAWDSLIPKGRGFVSVDKLLKAAQFQLPQDIIDLDTEHAGQFAISSFHQLHCLHMVVKSYFLAMDGHDHDVVHTKHCFEYLRSSIICSADSALEPWKKQLNGVDGFESRHMCRDFGALFKWAEEFRYSDIDP